MRHLSQLALAALGAATLSAQSPPSPDKYMMARDDEIALARTAAPANISGRASIKTLTASGFQVAHQGDNGFTCLVLRGWSAPTFTPANFRSFIYDTTLRAPICYNQAASRTVLVYQELRTRLGMEGKSPDQVADGVQSAYVRGAIPPMEGVAFAYMFSARQNLGPGIGAYHPHLMVFTPYQDNAMLGGNPFGGALPFVSDNAGTPFAVTVIPVDHALAVR